MTVEYDHKDSGAALDVTEFFVENEDVLEVPQFFIKNEDALEVPQIFIEAEASEPEHKERTHEDEKEGYGD